MPIATIAAARDAVLAHWKTNWDVAGIVYASLPVMYDDVKTDRPTDGGFLRLNLHHTGGDQRTMGSEGNRKFERLGMLTIQVFTAIGDGQTKSDLIVDIIKNIFEGRKSSVSGIWFRAVTWKRVGVSAGFWQTNIFVNFEYETLK